MTALPTMREDLDTLERAGLRRELAPRHGHDFSSNDYLGLAASPQLREAARAALDRGVAIGSGGSRLLRGNTPEHEALEAEAAAFFGAERALFLGSGYAANSLLFSTLPRRGDCIVHDALIHASAREGMRLGVAENIAFAHNDPATADEAITAWRHRGGIGTPWIAIESLYSMDGDRAPLAEFAALARQHDAMLLIDEAHATGLYGPVGRGLAADLDGRGDVVTLRTFGKALGCEGAAILGPATVCDMLINRGRGFIFSTAPSPLIAAVARAALRIVGQSEDRRSQLDARVAYATRAFARLGVTPSGSAIQPVVIGDDRAAMAIASALQADGFDVRGIRPPTVPVGTARLRVSLTLNTDEAAISDLVAALAHRL